MTANAQTITLGGQRFIILPEADYRELVGQTWEPPLPKADAKGNYPAVEAARVVLARKIIRLRRAAGLTQAELARRAGVVVVETLSRLEHAKHSPNVATVDKIVRTLEQAEASQPREAPASAAGRKAVGWRQGKIRWETVLFSKAYVRARFIGLARRRRSSARRLPRVKRGGMEHVFVSPDHGVPFPATQGLKPEAARRPANGRACSSPVGPMPPARNAVPGEPRRGGDSKAQRRSLGSEGNRPYPARPNGP